MTRQLPMGWELKKLGAVCKFEKTPKKQKQLPYVGLEHIESNTGLFIGSFEPLDVKSSTFQFDNLHILYGRLRPYLNKVLIPEFAGHCSTEIFPIKPFNSVERKFLFYWFLSDSTVAKINGTCTGARMPRADMNEILDFTIPFPPLSEQKRIVAILDEAFTAIAKAKENAEKNLKNARELFESYLQNIFANPSPDWEEKKLGDVCESVEYGTSSKSQREGKIPVLRMGNIQECKIDWNNLVYTSDTAEINRYSLKKNDILFNRTNSEELVGKTAIYKGEYPAIFAGYLIRINIKKNLIDADYLNICLNSKKLREYGFSVMTSSVNQANINGSKLKKYPLIIPPLSEQKRIVAKLDALSAETKRLKTIYKKKLSDLEELKKSILDKAFKGEL